MKHLNNFINEKLRIGKSIQIKNDTIEWLVSEYPDLTLDKKRSISSYKVINFSNDIMEKVDSYLAAVKANLQNDIEQVLKELKIEFNKFNCITQVNSGNNFFIQINDAVKHEKAMWITYLPLNKKFEIFMSTHKSQKENFSLFEPIAVKIIDHILNYNEE